MGVEERLLQVKNLDCDLFEFFNQDIVKTCSNQIFLFVSLHRALNLPILKVVATDGSSQGGCTKKVFSFSILAFSILSKLPYTWKSFVWF